MQLVKVPVFQVNIERNKIKNKIVSLEERILSIDEAIDAILFEVNEKCRVLPNPIESTIYLDSLIEVLIGSSEVRIEDISQCLPTHTSEEKTLVYVNGGHALVKTNCAKLLSLVRRRKIEDIIQTGDEKIDRLRTKRKTVIDEIESLKCELEIKTQENEIVVNQAFQNLKGFLTSNYGNNVQVTHENNAFNVTFTRFLPEYRVLDHGYPLNIKVEVPLT